MSANRPRIWIEEPSRDWGWSLVACEFCPRTWFPVNDARAFAERHAWSHANSAGLPPRVYDEADLSCIEQGCVRRAHHADGRCRACWVSAKRTAERLAA